MKGNNKNNASNGYNKCVVVSLVFLILFGLVLLGLNIYLVVKIDDYNLNKVHPDLMVCLIDSKSNNGFNEVHTENNLLKYAFDSKSTNPNAFDKNVVNKQPIPFNVVRVDSNDGYENYRYTVSKNGIYDVLIHLNLRLINSTQLIVRLYRCAAYDECRVLSTNNYRSYEHELYDVPFYQEQVVQMDYRGSFDKQDVLFASLQIVDHGTPHDGDAFVMSYDCGANYMQIINYT